MGVKRILLSALGGLGMLGATATAANAQDAPYIPARDHVRYEHEFFRSKGEQGSGSGRRDVIDFRVGLTDEFALDGMLRNGWYEGPDLRGRERSDSENAAELGLDAKYKGIWFDARATYSDNLDPLHEFRLEDIEGAGLKLGTGFLVAPRTELDLDARVMDLDPGGASYGFGARGIYYLSDTDWVTAGASGFHDDLRDANDYTAALSWRHALNSDIAFRLGATLGYEDFSPRVCHNDTPTWGVSAGIETRIIPGLFVDAGVSYMGATVDRLAGTVGITLKW